MEHSYLWVTGIVFPMQVQVCNAGWELVCVCVCVCVCVFVCVSDLYVGCCARICWIRPVHFVRFMLTMALFVLA